MTAEQRPREVKSGLGVELREARRARALSLDEVQRATRIAHRYLEALEQEDFAALPAPVFARGFLRSYAQYLGLDPAPLVARYLGEARPPDALPAPGVDPGAPAGARGGRRTSTDPRSAGLEDQGRADPLSYADPPLSPIPTIDTRSPSVRLGPWLVAALVALLVLGGVVAVVTLGDGQSPAAAPSAPAPGVSAAADLDQPQPASTLPTAINLETMPDLTQRDLVSAREILRRAGVPFVIVEVYDATRAAGAIVEQSPAPDALLEVSSTVTLLVSRGPRPSLSTPALEAAPPPLPGEPVADAGEP